MLSRPRSLSTVQVTATSRNVKCDVAVDAADNRLMITSTPRVSLSYEDPFCNVTVFVGRGSSDNGTAATGNGELFHPSIEIEGAEKGALKIDVGWERGLETPLTDKLSEGPTYFSVMTRSRIFAPCEGACVSKKKKPLCPSHYFF
jgi:hypothetical protein